VLEHLRRMPGSGAHVVDAQAVIDPDDGRVCLRMPTACCSLWYVQFVHVEQVASLDAQLRAAVIFLHSHGVAHRDVKPDNILLYPPNDLKLCDFGASTLLPKEGRGFRDVQTTHAYAAPEVLLGLAYDAARGDVWSVGVVVAEALCRVTHLLPPKTVLFDGSTPEAVLQQQEALLLATSERARTFRAAVFPQTRALLSYHPYDRSLDPLVRSDEGPAGASPSYPKLSPLSEPSLQRLLNCALAKEVDKEVGVQPSSEERHATRYTTHDSCREWMMQCVEGEACRLVVPTHVVQDFVGALWHSLLILYRRADRPRPTCMTAACATLACTFNLFGDSSVAWTESTFESMCGAAFERERFYGTQRTALFVVAECLSFVDTRTGTAVTVSSPRRDNSRKRTRSAENE
jgi:serine/threonine protein kinase